MPIEQDLLAFASNCPDWQRDSMRRICTQPELTESDKQEILVNLKAVEGLDKIITQSHLTADHLSDRTGVSHAETILTSLSDVKNANRLAPKQQLMFAEQGLTLIYGYNGSGKTGYGRILKQVCRSRHDKPEAILADVYAKGAVKPATATVAYKTGSVAKTAAWKDGSPGPEELGRISVFDAATAPLYADQQNRIQFLPMGLDVLPRLGKTCEELALILAGEITAVNTRLSVPLLAVSSQKFIQFLLRFGMANPISTVPSVQEIDTEFAWAASDEAAIVSVEDEIKKISEPAKLAALYSRLKSSLASIKTKISTGLIRFKNETITSDYGKFVDAKAARDAATIAAQGRFTEDPLGEMATTPAWRKLIESAEAFNAVAYPGESFPSTGKDRVCLLCQQTLSEAGSERLRRFKAFLQDTTQRDANLAEEKLRATVREITNIAIPTENEVEQQLAEVIAVKPEVTAVQEKLKTCSRTLASIKDLMLRCLKGELEVDKVGAADQSVVADIDAVSAGLDAEIQALNAQIKDDTVLTKLQEQHRELLDRKSCASNKAMFMSRRADLSTLAALKNCKDSCDTSAISRRSTKLRETYLTDDFRKKVAAEVEFLGLSYLPIIVDGRTERGVGYVGVALSKSGREPTSSILSEGEFRGLALACFFAEVSSIDGHDGIIVDDPVSSLDHMHVEQVARRLVQEAKTRPQVIVFTHDLSFYYETWVAAAREGISVHRNWIYRAGTEGFGTIASGDGPWQVKKVRERLQILEKTIADIPDDTTCTPKEYQEKTEEYYSMLRETWERLVEECLLNDVVGRFQPGVATQSLKGVSVTDDDYRKVYFSMKKASEYAGHDRPVGRPPTKRSKADMKQDLEDLRIYEKDLKKRANELEKQRKTLETPATAVITLPSS